jgi:DNA-binding MarR family transcriptional regulator
MPTSRPTSDSVLETVPLVMRIIRREFRSHRGPGFSVPEFRSLAFLNRTPGASLGELAEHIGIEAPTASKLVETLVQRGLVKRQEDPRDRRRMSLTILPKGKKSIDEATEQTRQFMVQRLAHLSEDERKQVLSAMSLLKGAFIGDPITLVKEHAQA